MPRKLMYIKLTELFSRLCVSLKFLPVYLYVCFDRVVYAGDNFVRYSGATISMAQTQCE